MDKQKRNYLIYIVMILVLGGLIYVALQAGEHFDGLNLSHSSSSESAITAFKQVITDNIRSGLSILLLQIIVILLAVRLFSYLFRYIGQPGVMGEIVAGIVLGPSLLGFLFPDFFGFLFRPDSLSNLKMISQIGLILFMFVIGLELNFGELRKKINETLVISHAGILLPFLLGIIVSYWAYTEYASGITDFRPFALFVGISMSITAFPVLARIIQERGLTKTPTGTLAIASAANDDITAWCLLAVVISITKAGNFTSALYGIALTIVYIFVMFALVRPFLKKIGEVYATGEVINKTFVGFILLILIISSALTELIGIHALFGAFIAGVVMPSNIGFRKIMMEKVEDVSLVFFLPLFFAYTGLHTEIGLINTPELWFLCGLFILAAVIGKLGGCAIAARAVGESWKDSLTIGTLMNTRGLMELIALNIGYEIGVLPPSIFVILVIMALVTTFMTTPLLHLIEKIYAKKAIKKAIVNKKLLLCFGRPQSGEELLSVYYLLFAKALYENPVLAAHYTVGTDLNPVKAEQYASESFVAIDIEAKRLNIPIEKHYKLTDKLPYEIAQLAKVENAGLLLIGSKLDTLKESLADINNNFNIFSSLLNIVKNSSLKLTPPLLYENFDYIIDQVRCPIGVFVNPNHIKPQKVVFLLTEKSDIFLIPFLKAIAEYGMHSIDILSEIDVLAELKDMEHIFKEQINIRTISGSDIALFNTENMLVVSNKGLSYVLKQNISTNLLPSFLVIRPTQQQLL